MFFRYACAHVHLGWRNSFSYYWCVAALFHFRRTWDDFGSSLWTAVYVCANGCMCVWEHICLRYLIWIPYLFFTSTRHSSPPHGSQGPRDLHMIVNSEHLHYQQVICAQGLSMLMKQLGLSLCHHAVPQSKGVPIFTQSSFIVIFKITKRKERQICYIYIYIYIYMYPTV